MTNEDNITALLHTYERSLNAGDAALAASCYARDGVFMPTNLPIVAGAAIRQAYEQIFSAIQLNVTFTIDQLVVASDDIAYALTRGNGTQTELDMVMRRGDPREVCGLNRNT